MANSVTVPLIIADIAPEIPQGDTVNGQPAYSGPNDARMQRFIGYAQQQINVSAWALKADLGTAYLTSHLMTRSGSASGAKAAGALTQEKVGDVQMSYAAPVNSGSNQDEELKTTPYGKMYLRLKSQLFCTPLVP